MNRKLIVGAFAAAALTTGAAFAQNVGQSYVGVNLGDGHSHAGCDSGSTTVLTCDKNETAWKLYGGYTFAPNLSGELTYFDLGHFKGSDSSGDATRVRASFWGLGAAYRPDFGSGWGGVARLGAAYGQSKVDYDISSVSGSETKDGWRPYYGLGVNYALTKDIKLEADWDNTRLTSHVDGGSSTNTYNVYSVGASFSF